MSLDEEEETTTEVVHRATKTATWQSTGSDKQMSTYKQNNLNLKWNHDESE